MPVSFHANRHDFPSTPRRARNEQDPERQAARILEETERCIEDFAKGKGSERHYATLLDALHDRDLNRHLSDGRTLLYKAVRSGRETLVTDLLIRQADPWIANRSSLNTPLHAAVDKGDIDLVMLIMKNARRSGKHLANELNDKGETPLYAAAAAGHTEIVQAMLREEGIDPDRECMDASQTGTTALRVAVLKEHYECVIALASHGAKDKHDWTALHFAVWYRMDDTIRSLLKKRVDIVSKDKHGRSALHLAVAFAREDSSDPLVHALLKAAKDRNVLAQLIDARQQEDGKTPLIKAAENNNLACVGALLEAGADVALKSDSGKSALHIAVEKNHTEMLALLLEAARKQSCLSDAVGACTWPSLPPPLIHAMMLGHASCMEKLLEMKEALASSDAQGKNVFHAAVEQADRTTLLRQCISAAKDHGLFDDLINGRSTNGKTPLLHAIRLGHAGCMGLLLAEGADPLIADIKGLNALGHAVESRRPELLKQLLTQLQKSLSFRKILHSACEGDELRTPLTFAAKLGHAEHAMAILRAGANFTYRDELGQNVLHAALQHGHAGLVSRVMAIATEKGELGKLLQATDADGNTPLLTALRHEGTMHVDAMLMAGADPATGDASGQNALHAAIDIDRLDLAKKFMAAAKKRGNATALLDGGTTPPLLYLAKCSLAPRVLALEQAGEEFADAAVEVDEKFAEWAFALLAAGATITARDDRGRNLLHIAAQHGNFELVQDLLNEGNHAAALKEMFGAGDDDGMPPLIHAAAYHPQNHVPGMGEDFRREQELSRRKFMRSACASGSAVTAQDKDGKNALHHAIELRQFDLIAAFLAAAARLGTADEFVNAKDSNGVAPLLYLARLQDAGREREAGMAALVKAGADLTARDASGRNVLHWALESGQLKLAMNLLTAAEARFSDGLADFASAVDEHDMTPLLMAMLHRLPSPEEQQEEEEENTALSTSAHAEFRDFLVGLVDAGADVSYVRMSGETMLHVAVANKSEGVLGITLDVLSEMAVEPDEAPGETLGHMMNRRDSYECTPLYYAVRENLPGHVRLLTSAGATVDSLVAGEALRHALKDGHDEVVQTLLRSLPEDAAVSDATSPLRDALTADIDSPDSLLALAVKYCDGQTLKMLVDRGGRFERDEEGNTLLHYAALHGARPDAVAFLLTLPLPAALQRQTDSDSWLEIRNEHGRTPLLCAAQNCKPDLVKLFIREGASLEAQDARHNNLFHIAADRGFIDIILAATAGVLSDEKRKAMSDAILNTRDVENYTPFDIALTERLDTIVMRFLEVLGTEEIALPHDEKNRLFLIETLAKSVDGMTKLESLFNNRFNRDSEWARNKPSALFKMKLHTGEHEAAVALLPALDDKTVYRHRKVLLSAAFGSRGGLTHEQKYRLATQIGTMYIDCLCGDAVFGDADSGDIEKALSITQPYVARCFAAILFGGMSMYEGLADKHEGLLDKFEEAGKSPGLRKAILNLVRRIDCERHEHGVRPDVFTGAPLLPREEDPQTFRDDLARLQAMELPARLLQLLDREKYSLPSAGPVSV